MPLQFVTLTGTLPRAGGALVTFTPSNWLTDEDDDLLIPPAPQPVSLDANGQFSEELLATDSTGPLPAGWFWTVVIAGIPGVAVETFSFFLPITDCATQDISDLAEISPVQVMTACMPLSGGQFTGGVAPAEAGLADGASIAVDANLANLFRVTLGGNRVLALPAGGKDGQVIRVEVTQDATGSRVLSFAPGYDFGSAGPVLLSTAPGERDVLLFSRNVPAGTWDVLAFAAGY